MTDETQDAPAQENTEAQTDTPTATEKEMTPEKTTVEATETSPEEPSSAMEEGAEEPMANIVEETDEEPVGPVVTLEGASAVKPGMTIIVHERIKDVNAKGEVKERIQKFEGIVLSLRGSDISKTMTVRKISKGGFEVEKIYPLFSPVIAKIEAVKQAHVRRAKLSYITNAKSGFKRKLKERSLEK